MTKPLIGQTIEVYGLACIIRIIRPFGTVDVEHVESGRWYRVSGLPV